MFEHGIKASELIKKLEEMIKAHGDREVYSGGTDYPEGVAGVYFNKESQPYYPERSFIIR